jgi:hypothetical protein
MLDFPEIRVTGDDGPLFETGERDALIPSLETAGRAQRRLSHIASFRWDV